MNTGYKFNRAEILNLGISRVTTDALENASDAAQTLFNNTNSIVKYSFIYTDANARVKSTVEASNGEILIGRTGLEPIKGSIVGSPNQIIVTNGPGTIGLSTPLTSTPLATGFKIEGGTISKILTVPDFASVTGTNTGDQTITLTGPVTGSGTGTFATTIEPNVVDNTMLAQMATQTIKGRNTAGTGDPEDLDASTVLAMLGITLPVTGTYTPTLTNVANLTASTAYQCQYVQVNDMVTVSGKVDIDPTLTATSTQLGISLPVASNFGAAEDCAGVAFASSTVGQGAAILADTANDRAQLQYISGDATNQPMYFTFTYRVI